MTRERVRTGLLLVEDDPRFRAAVETLIADRFEVHPTALARVGLQRLAEVPIEVAVVDLGLPDADGIDLIRSIRALRPHVAIVALTVSDTRDRVVAALEAGARAYVLKEHVARELEPAIDAALAGQISLSARAAAHVMTSLDSGVPDPAAGPPLLLTPTERRVLEELARGLSYAQIGLVLDISINTVRSRIRTLFEKLEVASSTEAIAVAVRRGLIRMRP